uniref:Uncharacterized protein n=1 Tax=Chromera velia CCMP2878 TaxID=1169474 RepID=A0A0G4H8E1_9ALVE|eukprot:Cvel_25077.t1-p1 / transcript=Cvel_25077.t1 / gene=Cvel_25077 / organism=Chromera_velia_CCMP2878 / gene_product=hypothetical protein / transcript_product=hypothetical protein / location=Cvel_scaffold2792:313-9493(-) / protein_length=186 / sequence_SO=supercontig / SO=protein_coding / is_pseudo=false
MQVFDTNWRPPVGRGPLPTPVLRVTPKVFDTNWRPPVGRRPLPMPVPRVTPKIAFHEGTGSAGGSPVQGALKKPKPDKPNKPNKPNKPLIFLNKPRSSGETAERPIRNWLDVAALMQRADLTDGEKVDRLVKCLKEKKDMELIQAWFTNLLEVHVVCGCCFFFLASSPQEDSSPLLLYYLHDQNTW